MPQNGWTFTSVPSQTVKFTYDTNNHATDAGWPYYPQQNIPNAWDDMPATFTAVGDWQGLGTHRHSYNHEQSGQ